MGTVNRSANANGVGGTRPPSSAVVPPTTWLIWHCLVDVQINLVDAALYGAMIAPAAPFSLSDFYIANLCHC